MSDSDDRIVRIEDKIDKVNDRLSSIDSTLSAQHESLKEHMRRTELLESRVDPMVKQGAVVKFLLQAIIYGSIIEIVLRYVLKV